ncbi:MAG: RNA polymerase sigma-70 factor [Bacteroidota bacterium]
MQQSSDEELLQLCSNDDLCAYNELFDRYYPKLYRLASRYVKDIMTAEELSMDLLYSLWQKRRKLVINNGFSAYIFRSMRNLVVDHLRKNIPVTTSIDLVSENDHLTGSYADDDLLAREVQSVYQRKLNELSPQRRKVFQLSREENMTYPEIAREMNLSVNTVENYMVAALATLRKGMSEYTTTALLIAGISTLHNLL